MDSQRSPVPTFWMFIVVGLIITLSFGVTAIWRSAQQPLDNARDDFVYIQNRLIEDRLVRCLFRPGDRGPCHGAARQHHAPIRQPLCR